MRVGSVLTKKLTRILTSIANELICHHDTRDLAKMSFYSRVSGISFPSGFAVRSDTTTSMVGAWSKATRSLRTS